MRRARSIIATVLLLGLLGTLPGQTPGQAVKPAQAARTTDSGVNLRARARLVVVDVVVIQGNKAVHGLKQSEFTLTEQGAPQVITHFEEHAAPTPADAARFAPLPQLPIDTFTNYAPAPANGAVGVLLLDALNTPLEDQSYLRDQLLEYLKAAPPKTRIAIFGLNRGLTMLQGFTSDPALLKAVLTSRRSRSSSLLDDPIGDGGIANSTADRLEDLHLPTMPPELVANLRQFEAERQSSQLQFRAKDTLAAMSQLARYLAVIPGRKNLLWFSGSFPIDILPDMTGTLRDPFGVMASSEDEFRATVNLLARSQVAVYPIDARGLQVSPVFDAATSRNYTSNAARFSQDQEKFTSDIASEHDTMRRMAESTGGRAFVNTNGLTEAIAHAIEEGSNFYTLMYTPADSAGKGEFRKIKISLDRPDTKLSYRRGYYADMPASTWSQSAPPGSVPAKPLSPAQDAAAAAKADASETLHAVMTRGAPTPSEILMKVGVFPVGGPGHLEAAPAPNNLLSAKVGGPFRRYSVSFAIDPSGITFLVAPNGRVTCDAELLVLVFTPDGNVVNRLGTRVRLDMTREELQKKIGGGLRAMQEISVPAKGEYFLRIAVHDLPHERYGVVEVATSEVKQLAIATPTPSPASPSPAASTVVPVGPTAPPAAPKL